MTTTTTMVADAAAAIVEVPFLLVHGTTLLALGAAWLLWLLLFGEDSSSDRLKPKKLLLPPLASSSSSLPVDLVQHARTLGKTIYRLPFTTNNKNNNKKKTKKNNKEVYIVGNANVARTVLTEGRRLSSPIFGNDHTTTMTVIAPAFTAASIPRTTRLCRHWAHEWCRRRLEDRAAPPSTVVTTTTTKKSSSLSKKNDSKNHHNTTTPTTTTTTTTPTKNSSAKTTTNNSTTTSRTGGGTAWDPRVEMQRLMMQIVCDVLLDYPVSEAEADALVQQQQQVGTKKAMLESSHRHEFMTRALQHHRQQQKNNNGNHQQQQQTTTTPPLSPSSSSMSSSTSSTSSSSLKKKSYYAQLLIHLVDEHSAWTESEKCTILWRLVDKAVETTSGFLTNALVLVSQHNDVAAAVRRDLAAHKDRSTNKNDDDDSYSDSENEEDEGPTSLYFQYLLKEIHRVCPVTPVVSVRTLENDLVYNTLDDDDNNKTNSNIKTKTNTDTTTTTTTAPAPLSYTIPAEATVWLVPWIALQGSGFDHPEKFQPVRWSRATPAMRQAAAFLLASQACVGHSLSVAALTTILPRLWRDYEWTVVQPGTLEYHDDHDVVVMTYHNAQLRARRCFNNGAGDGISTTGSIYSMTSTVNTSNYKKKKNSKGQKTSSSVGSPSKKVPSKGSKTGASPSRKQGQKIGATTPSKKEPVKGNKNGATSSPSNKVGTKITTSTTKPNGAATKPNGAAAKQEELKKHNGK